MADKDKDKGNDKGMSRIHGEMHFGQIYQMLLRVRYLFGVLWYHNGFEYIFKSIDLLGGVK